MGKRDAPSSPPSSSSSSASSSAPQKKRPKTSGGTPASQDSGELPLLLPKSSNTRTMLVQLDERVLNMKGDAGTIGRLRVGKDSRVTIDLNGTKLRGSLFPSVSCMVVKIGKSEATVSSLVNEVCVVTGQTDSLKVLRGEAEEGPSLGEDSDGR